MWLKDNSCEEVIRKSWGEGQQAGTAGSLIGRFLHVRKILKLGTNTHLAMSVIHLRKNWQS